MKICARYPKFWTKVLDEGFSHGTLIPATIKLIFVLITKSISVLLGLIPALLDILPLQFFLSALVVPAFVSLS